MVRVAAVAAVVGIVVFAGCLREYEALLLLVGMVMALVWGLFVVMSMVLD